VRQLSALLSAREVKARADLVAIAGKYTRLRRAGRQFVGLCPLHSERHPSFFVHPERQVWFCFGCNRGGDIFDFVMLAESCDFLEALRIVSNFSSGVAAASGLRSSPRFGSGVGASPGLAKQGISHSPESRADILAALDATNRRVHAIEATNRAASAALATACEPHC